MALAPPAASLFLALLETTGEGVLVCGPGGGVLVANAPAGRILGASPDALIGRMPLSEGGDFLDLDGQRWPPSELPYLVCERTGEPISGRTIGLTRGEGAMLWLSVSCRRLVDGQTSIGTLVTLVDVTAGTRARRRLLEKETEHQLLAEHSRDIISRHRADGSLTWASPAITEILGYSTQALVGRFLTHLAHPDDLEALLGLWLTATTSKSPDSPPATWRAYTVDKQIRWLETRSRVRRDPVSGATIEFVAFSRDVTERMEAQRASGASEARFRRLTSFAPVGIFATDARGACTYTNERWQQIYGISADAALGDGWKAALHTADRAEFGQLWERTTAEGGLFEREFRLEEPGSGQRWVRTRAIALLDAEGRIEGHIGSVEDITEVRANNTATAEAGALFLATFEASPIGMALTTTSGRFRKVNHALAELTGMTARELRGASLRMIAPFADGEALDADLDGRLDLAAGGRLHLELRLLRPDGTQRWASLHLTRIQRPGDRPPEILAQVIDVTERRTFEDQLRQMADHDPLTGLLNRRAFSRSLEEHHTRVSRYRVDGALLVLDLDNFKAVNDSLGHHTGDELLTGVAEVLKARIRRADVPARLGGDEFAILLPNTGRAGAELLATDLVEAIRARAADVRPAGHPGVTTSVGIAIFDPEHPGPEALLRTADVAMYTAKEAGGDRWSLAPEGRRGLTLTPPGQH